MSTPYVSDKVKALPNTAVWYVRLTNLQQAQKVFNKAVALVENEGGLVKTSVSQPTHRPPHPHLAMLASMREALLQI